MTDTPDDPRVPAPGADDPTEPQAHVAQPPAARDPGPGSIELGGLAPLDDLEPVRHRVVTPSRILGLAAVLVLVIGGAAFALTRGGDDKNGDDGVASIDGNGSNNSNGSGSGSKSNKPPSEAEMQDAALKFADCMRKHGVNMPDPKVDGNGGMSIEIQGGPPGAGGNASAQQKTMGTAQKACQHFMDDVAPQRDLSPEEVAKMQDQQRALAQCMRGKGYDMPDPKVDSDGRVTIGAGPGSGGAATPKPGQKGPDAKFQKDMEACAEKAGMKGPRGPGGKGGDGAFSTQVDGGGST
jgi:hypothetical protein